MARTSLRIANRAEFDEFWARGVELWRSERLRTAAAGGAGISSSTESWTPPRPPVDQQVWWQYSIHDRDHLLDLIIEPSAAGTADAARHLRARVIDEPSVTAETAAISEGFGYVAIRLEYEPMVTRLLPLTSWGELLAGARALTVKDRLAAMRLYHGADEGPPPPIDGVTRPRLLLLGWLLHLLAICEPDGIVSSPTITYGQKSLAVRRVNALLARASDPLSPSLGPGAAAQGLPSRTYDIGRVTLNRIVRGSVTRSSRTVKVDATRGLFGVRGEGIRWAVVDSGIDARHTAFRRIRPADGLPFDRPFDSGDVVFNYTRVTEAFDFTRLRTTGADPGRQERAARNLADGELPGNVPIGLTLGPKLYEPPENGHGTHVAGIIGGRDGLCPDIELLDYRVLDSKGRGNEFVVVAALRWILRTIQLSADPSGRSRDLPIHGVNLSLSLDVDVTADACGWSLVCRACDDLVRAGVVVVASAGNTGFEDRAGANVATGQNYRTVSITDPGNTERVITVGATDADRPREYGVSFFSARGPTADGRPKPDLVAPGNAIRSAFGYRLRDDDRTDEYVTLDGTSQAAAHVSGCAAILMSRHRELIGRPEEVKRILIDSATDLGRDRTFQGAGLVDALRAVQSI